MSRPHVSICRQKGSPCGIVYTFPSAERQALETIGGRVTSNCLPINIQETRLNAPAVVTSGSQCFALQIFSKLIQGPCDSDHAGRGALRCQFQSLAPRPLDSQPLWRWDWRICLCRYPSCFTETTPLIKSYQCWRSKVSSW